VEAGVQYVKRNAPWAAAPSATYTTTPASLVNALDHQPLPALTPPVPAGPAVAPRPPLDHLLPQPRCRREEVRRMEVTHQLTPMLRILRLSGILETLGVRNRQAVEQQSSFVEF
jgi:hypothetical protein